MGNVCFECKSCGFILFWGRFKCIFQEFMYVCVICSYPKKKKKKKKKVCYMLYVVGSSSFCVNCSSEVGKSLTANSWHCFG